MTVKAESKASCCQTCNPQLGYLASSTVAWAKSYQFFHQSTFLFSFLFQRHGPHEIIKRPPFISLCPQCSLSLSLSPSISSSFSSPGKLELNYHCFHGPISLILSLLNSMLKLGSFAWEESLLLLLIQ